MYLFLGYFLAPFHSNYDITQRSGQIFVYRGMFWKTGWSWFHQYKLHIVFMGIKHFRGRIFWRPMLRYNKGIVKIQKMRKQRYLFLLQPCLWIFKICPIQNLQIWSVLHLILIINNPKQLKTKCLKWFKNVGPVCGHKVYKKIIIPYCL